MRSSTHEIMDEMKRNEPEKIQKLFDSYLIDSPPVITSRKQMIGWGGYSEVFLCDYMHQPVAVKRTKKSKMKLSEFSQEIKAMIELTEAKTENVIPLLGFNVNTSCYKIVMEYASNGSLAKYLFMNNINWNVKSQFIYGTTNGLKSIHQYRIIHCDFKCSNIMVDENLQIKIGDFGNSVFENSENALLFTSEIDIDDEHYSPKTDVHSLGLVLRDIASGKPDELSYTLMNDTKFIAQTPKKLLSLIYRCCDRDPNKRPTSAEANEEVSQENFFQRNSKL